MPVPIIYLDDELCHFVARYRQQFSRPQSHLASPRTRFDGIYCAPVCGQDRFAAALRVSVDERGEA